MLIGPRFGKSTMLRCINGLEAFDGGEIAVAGDGFPEIRLTATVNSSSASFAVMSAWCFSSSIFFLICRFSAT